MADQAPCHSVEAGSSAKLADTMSALCLDASVAAAAAVSTAEAAATLTTAAAAAAAAAGRSPSH